MSRKDKLLVLLDAGITRQELQSFLRVHPRTIKGWMSEGDEEARSTSGEVLNSLVELVSQGDRMRDFVLARVGRVSLQQFIVELTNRALNKE